MVKNEVKKAHAIEVGLDGYLYLQNRCFTERCGQPHNESQLARLTANFERHSNGGYMMLMDGDLGGCENGRWTSWTAAQMADMLTEQGLDWQPHDDVEFVGVYLSN